MSDLNSGHNNWKTSVIDKSFHIDDATISESFWYDIECFLEWDSLFISHEFDLERKIHDCWWNYYLVEYKDKALRDNEKNLIQKNYKFKDKHLSESLPWWLQLWEVSWSFESNWRFFIILDAHNPLINWIDTITFRWIIVNASKYFESTKSGETVNKTNERYKDIM
ncbi:MAG: hypothetical protein ACD_3C00099G0001 [uncultured bacterium (gcode 4)]|uniref:Uncharacterized protein n=1 Tax=uncultured bacterium (gcode 4) TaxID=1234023 RepID=K2G1N0_9BACT|nr:MAG: hypothetical protein ACD_3C00099G0001 [uncultured bacterium (gcode 4)]